MEELAEKQLNCDPNEFVKLVNVNKIYDKNVHAVYDFNLSIKQKEFVVFVGPSGCGKSTTLRMIAGLEEISSGQLYIDGVLSNDSLSKERDIAMVFQSYALYPNMTVFDNMAFSLKVRHFPKEEIKQRVLEAAQILELEDYLDRKPSQLSGGQKQRVALGRAIVRKARIFLLDEPLSNLDAKLRVQMRSEIIKLHKKIGTTSIYVTHDQTEAMTMADRIVVMRAGFVQQIGTPYDIYRHPANKFVASFIGSPAMNFVNAIYDKGSLLFEDGYSLKLDKDQIAVHDNFYKDLVIDLEKRIEEIQEMPDEEIKVAKKKSKSAKGASKIKTKAEMLEEKEKQLEKAKAIAAGNKHEITFGIRPESIKNVEKENKDTLKKEIKLSELLGDEYFIHIDFGGKDILAKITSESLIKEGQNILLEFNNQRIHLFDKITQKTIL